MEHLLKHRSIRRYKQDDVSESLLTKIIEVGVRASTTGNMQLYSVVVTRNSETRAQLAPLHCKEQFLNNKFLSLLILQQGKYFVQITKHQS